MALITSAATGNFNAGATWTGGVVPTVGDEARASNGHTVTITANVTCDEVSNAGTGIFTLNDGITLTANVTSKSTTTSRNCLQFTASSPASATIVGNCTGGTVSNAAAVSHGSTGTLTITGNVTGGSASGAFGVSNAATGILTITGNVTGGSATDGFGANNQSTGTLTITGNVTGGSASGAHGLRNQATGTATIVGSAIASATAFGANNVSTGILTVTRAVGNAYGIGAAGGTGLAYGLNSANIGSDTRAEELEYGENGAAPTNGAVRIVSASNNKCIVELTTSARKTLADPSDGTGQANEADVRSGTSYALGNKTGTCAVPAAGSVALGVAVDATTGTAVLTPAAVWDALTSGMTTSGSIGARLKNAATLDSTGQQLADALSPVP
jgi:hypothetical protein